MQSQGWTMLKRALIDQRLRVMTEDEIVIIMLHAEKIATQEADTLRVHHEEKLSCLRLLRLHLPIRRG